MDASLRNTPALLNHVDKLTAQLVNRFVNILDLAKPAEPVTQDEEDTSSRGIVLDHTQAAANSFRMEVETAALIRASEDILTLTRQMKETWLFGQLNTLSESHVEDETAAEAQAVGKLLQQSMGSQSAARL